ncbi:MAG TPA: ORF6N domain-containing protein, partial [Bryobacteraceae bacterium]|nr:ORF6N domain-containing protein [Bryobacteraceae bacterium]
MTASRKARRAAPARPAKRPRSAGKSLVPTQPVEPLIRILRGHKIMLDSDLAALYGVPTKSLNLAVRRNAGRFPGDFMFQLTAAET